MIDTTKTSTTESSSSDESKKVTSQNQTLSKAERNKENGREIDGIIDRWNKMSSKSSGAKSMTSSITIPMSNSGKESSDCRSFVHATLKSPLISISGDSSVTLSNDSYHLSDNFDDETAPDITYVTKVGKDMYWSVI